MKDPEFIMLRNRFLLGIIVAIIFVLPLFYFFKNKLLFDESTISKIRDNKKLTLLVVENKCEECQEYEKILKANNILYTKINKYKDKSYELVLNELGISNDDVPSPTIIYIEEQKVVATLPKMESEEEITNFITNYSIERDIE